VTKRKSAGYDLMPFAIILVIVALFLTIYIGYRAYISDRNLFSLSLVAVFAGLFYESFRISENWKHVIYKFIGTYIFSLLSFLPGRKEQVYDFEIHIEIWPYYFIFCFSILSIIIHQDKLIAKLTEGTTLMLSLSIIYWTLDYGFLNIDHWFAKTCIIVALLFSLFSIVHALTYIKLSRSVRLTLSIWSTVITGIFAIENIIKVYSNGDITSTQYLPHGLFISLQYFLLGVSAIYIIQNIYLLFSFLPSRNGNYRRELKETINQHIDRFSPNQVYIFQSVLGILYTVVIYGTNHKYQIMPTHMAIWLVFMTFPLISLFLGLPNKYPTEKMFVKY
jgi:hypothetical protein